MRKTFLAIFLVLASIAVSGCAQKCDPNLPPDEYEKCKNAKRALYIDP